jgi:tRNA(Arg) A34 adenosine deaminase TadA
MSDDQHFLTLAAQLSRQGMSNLAGGPFGAVIVKDGTVIAEGWNEVTSDFDPTAHGEVNAIRRACKALKTFSLEGCVIYSSCEPCPMCLGAIYWARLDRLVFANTRWEAAEIGFDDDWIYREVPKPLAERLIPTLHLPNAEAKAVFAEWLSLPNKVPY